MNKLKLYFIIILLLFLYCAPGLPKKDFRITSEIDEELLSNPIDYSETTFSYEADNHIFWTSSIEEDQYGTIKYSYNQNLDKNGFPLSRIKTQYDGITGEPSSNSTFYDYIFDKDKFLPTTVIKSYGTISDHPSSEKIQYEYDENGVITSYTEYKYYSGGVRLEKETKIKKFQDSIKKTNLENLMTCNTNKFEVLLIIFFNEYSISYLDDGHTIMEKSELELDENGDPSYYYLTRYYENESTPIDPPEIVDSLYFSITKNQEGLYKRIDLYNDSDHTDIYDTISRIEYQYDNNNIISNMIIYSYEDVNSGSGDYWYLPNIRYKFNWIEIKKYSRLGNYLYIDRKILDKSAWKNDYQADPDNPPNFEDYYLIYSKTNYEWNDDINQLLVIIQQYDAVNQEMVDIYRYTKNFELTPQNID